MKTFRVDGTIIGAVRMTQRSKFGARAQRYLAYKAEIGARAREAGCWPVEGQIGVSIFCHAKEELKCDLDNAIKSVLDGCNGVAWVDDDQVKFIQAKAFEGGGSEYIEVNIWKLEDDHVV